jgi:hypothetical protein
MKWLLCIVLTTIGFKSFAAKYENDEVKVLIEPMWQDLEPSNVKVSQFGGKWILVGNITFKKKIKDSLLLTKIDLHWNGAPLQNLIGSLYDKPLDKEFMPIEDSLLSDGHWNKNTQTLILKFNKSKPLNAVSTFCVVLTVPEKLEPILKHGSFDILTSSMPQPISPPMHDSLRLSLDILDTISIKADH